MALFLFANDAATTLAAPISNSATSLTVAAGTGSEFPNPSAGQQFAATLNDAATGLLAEIVYCTVRGGDTFTTIERAQESTTALSWLAGDLCTNMCTAGTMEAFEQTANTSPARTVTASGAFAMSTADAFGAILLDRTVSPGASSTTLPSSTGGEIYKIADGANNFNLYPVTITYPGGTTGPNGATTAVLNVAGQVAEFEFFSDSNIWSFKP